MQIKIENALFLTELNKTTSTKLPFVRAVKIRTSQTKPINEQSLLVRNSGLKSNRKRTATNGSNLPEKPIKKP